MYYSSINELSTAKGVSLLEIARLLGLTDQAAYRKFKKNDLNVFELMKIASVFKLTIEINPIQEIKVLFHSDLSLGPLTVVNSPHKSVNSYLKEIKISPLRDFIIEKSGISEYQFERRNNDNTLFRVSELILLLKALNLKAFIGGVFFLLIKENK